MSATKAWLESCAARLIVVQGLRDQPGADGVWDQVMDGTITPSDPLGIEWERDGVAYRAHDPQLLQGSDR